MSFSFVLFLKGFNTWIEYGFSHVSIDFTRIMNFLFYGGECQFFLWRVTLCFW